jgi:hypothetical protein
MNSTSSRMGAIVGMAAILSTGFIRVVAGRGLSFGASLALGLVVSIAFYLLGISMRKRPVRPTRSVAGEHLGPSHDSTSSMEFRWRRDVTHLGGGAPIGNLHLVAAGLQRIIELALQEAKHFDHRHLGTEHLLLGLLREGEDAGGILQDQGVRYSDVYRAVEHIAGRGSVAGADVIEITPRATAVFELAETMARDMGHEDPSPIHLLLALMLQSDTTSAKALTRLGVDIEKVRDHALRAIEPGRRKT